MLSSDLSERGEGQAGVAAVRLLAQPEELTRRLKLIGGLGLNVYSGEIDYYGDQFEERSAAARAGLDHPPAGGRIVELPFVVDDILGARPPRARRRAGAADGVAAALRGGVALLG